MAFSRSWPKIVCPPTLLSIVKSFHDNMKGTVLYDGATSDPFNILSGMKQCCVLTPTLFGIFFATLLKHAFGKSTEGIYLRTRSDGKRDLRALGINTDSWEVTATDRDAWRHTVKVRLSQYEEIQRVKAEEKRLRKKTNYSLHMFQVWKGLPLPNWSSES